MRKKEFTINHNGDESDSSVVDEVRLIVESIDRASPGRSYRNSIITELEKFGWSGKVPIHFDSKSSIDGIKRNIGVAVQVGNHRSGMISIFNLEYLFRIGKISSAILITQTFEQAVHRNSLGNPGVRTNGNYMNFQKLVPDLELYSTFLECPIRVIAIDR